MPGKKTPVHHMYSVFINSYADAGIKERVERGEEKISRMDQLKSEMPYQGSSERQAGYAFYRACRAALSNPLAFSVSAYRGNEIMAKVIIDRP